MPIIGHVDAQRDVTHLCHAAAEIGIAAHPGPIKPRQQQRAGLSLALDLWRDRPLAQQDDCRARIIRIGLTEHLDIVARQDIELPAFVSQRIDPGFAPFGFGIKGQLAGQIGAQFRLAAGLIEGGQMGIDHFGGQQFHAVDRPPGQGFEAAAIDPDLGHPIVVGIPGGLRAIRIAQQAGIVDRQQPGRNPLDPRCGHHALFARPRNWHCIRRAGIVMRDGRSTLGKIGIWRRQGHGASGGGEAQKDHAVAPTALPPRQADNSAKDKPQLVFDSYLRIK